MALKTISRDNTIHRFLKSYISVSLDKRFPGGPVVKTLSPNPGAQFQSLVGALRFPVLNGAV